MSNKAGIWIATLALIVLACSSCIKNCEVIQVHGDGAIDIEISAKGKPEDLSDGFSVPLHAPFTPATDPKSDTSWWIKEVGADTGSKAVFDRVAALRVGNTWTAQTELSLVSIAHFASVAGLSTSFVPQNGSSYPTAYLQRTASLQIESKGGRKIYTFERRFRSRSGFAARVWERLVERHRPAIQTIESKANLNPEQRRRLEESIQNGLWEISDYFVREALGALYIEGDASLSLSGRDQLVSQLRLDVAATATRARVGEILSLSIPETGATPESKQQAGAAFKALESELRDTLRGSLQRELTKQRLAEPMLYGVLGRLEWLITEHDHSSDLDDEEFEVVVAMPGTVIAGNFAEIDSERVVFRFKGTELRDQDVVLRVVSALE